MSNTFLPKNYANFQAVDPETKQYYGYGKTLSFISPTFDVAAVIYDNKSGEYKTYIRGTYEKQRLTSLIRSYSSSSFVSQDSTEDLPYNPYERKISAFITTYSGSVVINDDSSRSLTGELNSGDKIVIATGSTALLHISDGSELSLGSTSSETSLTLSSLTYADDNNLASRVSLLLSLGEVWTEAPRLRTETDSASDFSIQTDSAVAAVRGTIFGISKSTTGATSISLEVGKIEVGKIIPVTNTITKAESFTGASGFVSDPTGTATSGFVIQSTTGTTAGPSVEKSYIIVPEDGTPLRI